MFSICQLSHIIQKTCNNIRVIFYLPVIDYTRLPCRPAKLQRRRQRRKLAVMMKLQPPMVLERR